MVRTTITLQAVKAIWKHYESHLIVTIMQFKRLQRRIIDDYLKEETIENWERFVSKVFALEEMRREASKDRLIQRNDYLRHVPSQKTYKIISINPNHIVLENIKSSKWSTIENSAEELSLYEHIINKL